MFATATKQLFRAPIRLIISIILLVTCVVFGGIAWHMYSSATQSLKKADESISTVVTIESYPDEKLQYDSSLVQQLKASPHIKSLDMRVFLSAYCDEVRTDNVEDNSHPLYDFRGVQIVKGIIGEHTIAGSGDNTYNFVDVTVTELLYISPYGYGVEIGNKYHVDADNIRYTSYGIQDESELNKGDELYLIIWQSGTFYIPTFEEQSSRVLSAGFYTDKEYIENFIRLMDISFHSLGAFLTNDMDTVLAVHQNKLSVIEGRSLIKDDEEKVCLVNSQDMLRNGWTLGDKIPLSFYLLNSFDAENGTHTKEAPVLVTDSKYEDIFIYSDEFTIVGVYESSMTEGRYGINPNTIFVPIGSVEYDFPTENTKRFEQYGMYDKELTEQFNQEHPDIDGQILLNDYAYHSANFDANCVSAIINNDSVDEFYADIQPLMDEYEGLTLTFYDQGYKYISTSLINLQRVAIILMCLSAAVAVLTCTLLVALTLHKNREQLRINKCLGASKRVQRVALYATVLPTLIISVIVGTILCGMLADNITQKVFEERQNIEEQRIEYSADMSFGYDEPVNTDSLVQGNSYMNAALAAGAIFLFTVSIYAVGTNHLINKSVVELKRKE